MDIITLIKTRNEALFWFTILNAAVALVLIAISIVNPIEFKGANAWHKPIKFALATAILSGSIALYSTYLPKSTDMQVVNWVLIITLAFEVFYITFQAARGQASHYNVSSSTYSMLYNLMAIAASVATLAVAYVGYKFFTTNIPTLPKYYIWAIRLGMILFVIFSFEGFAMGAAMRHSVGGEDGTKGLPFLNWSRTLGDLRVAHFIGMHALQILPFLAFYVLKDTRYVVIVSAVYGILAVYVLVQALQAKPFIKQKNEIIQKRIETN